MSAKDAPRRSIARARLSDSSRRSIARSIASEPAMLEDSSTASPHQQPVAGQVGHSTMVMAAGTLISKITGFLRLAALAAVLGVHSSLVEAYNVANTTPNIVHDLVAGGILASTAVPVFVQHLEDRDRGWKDVSAVVSVTTVVLVVMTGLLALAAPLLVALFNLGASGPGLALQQQDSVKLLRLFSLQLLFYGGISLLTAVLNARRSFKSPAWAPIANNLVVIATLVTAAVAYPHRNLIGTQHSPGLLWLLGLGTTAGVAAQLAVMFPSLRSIRARIRPRWDPSNPALRAIVGMSGWTLGYIAMNQVTLFVILALAHGIEPKGGVSAWTYAYTFFQLPIGVLAVSLMSAFQPELASAWARGDKRAFRRRFSPGLSAAVATTLPAALGYVVLGAAVVRLVLAHGAGAHTGMGGTGTLLTTMALGLPGFSAYLFLVSSWQATRNARRVFQIYAVKNGTNLVLAFALAIPFGVSGLGLALAGAYSTGALYALAKAKSAGLAPRRVGMASVAGAVGVPSLVMAAAVWWLESHLLHGASALVQVLAGVAVGIGVFAVVAALSYLAGIRIAASPRPRRRESHGRRGRRDR